MVVSLDCSGHRHVAVEVVIWRVGRPTSGDELREHGERELGEDGVERHFHLLGPFFDVRSAIVVEVRLDVDDDLDVEAALDDHRDELDAAGTEWALLAVEASGDDLLAGVLEKVQSACL